jgi:methyl-accepting chemotaxis protein
MGLASLNYDLRRIVESRHPKTEHLHAMIHETNAVSVALRNAIIATTEEDTATHVKRVSAGRQAVGEMLEKLDTAFAAEDEKGKQLQQGLHDQNSAYMVELIKLARALSAGKKEMAASLLLTSLQPKLEKYQFALRTLSEYEEELMKRAQVHAAASYQNGRNWILGMLLLAVFVTAGLAYVLTRSIIRPLRSAGGLAAAIAAADLTTRVEVTGKDETAALLRSLEAMQERLVGIVAEVKAASDNINTAANEIGAGNNDLSQRTEHQANSLEQTAASLDELTSTVKQNAENARLANQLASGASEVAVRGGEVVGQVVSTMGDINTSSKRIADIIGVIDGIAFQTNILALNAAVEAARAGEQGRGFAVVATEVRALAQRSAAAAKEIKALISDSVQKVKSGSELVDHAGKTMDEIVSAVKRVTDIMAEITAASAEQSAGIEQVNQAVTRMEDMTQQNAALVEEAAAAAESLQGQASTLSATVAVFKLSGEVSVQNSPVGLEAAAGANEQESTMSGEAHEPKAHPHAARVAVPTDSVAGRHTVAKTGTHDDWSEF